MSCVIQDGRCHTAPEQEFSGDSNIFLLISRRFVGSTNLRFRLVRLESYCLPTRPSTPVLCTGQAP